MDGTVETTPSQNGTDDLLEELRLEVMDLQHRILNAEIRGAREERAATLRFLHEKGRFFSVEGLKRVITNGGHL